MRHRVRGHKLGRTGAHRQAMFRNQLSALFEHERIVTTLAKAKALRPLAERMVTLARTGSLAARRQVLRSVPNKEVVAHLFDDIAPRFVDRPGGYTRILRMGRRHGDGAELAIIELVDYTLEKKQEGGGDKKGSLMDRAKGMFGGGRKAEAAGETEVSEQAQEQETAPDDAPEEKPKKRARKPATKKAAAKAAETADEPPAAADEGPAEAEPTGEDDEK